MNVRCHSFEYSAYNDMEAHNGTPHMTHEQILQFTILTYIFKGGLFFLKFRFFIFNLFNTYDLFWRYMCTMDDVRQSQLLMNISKYSLQTCNKICDICAHITRRKMLLVLCVFSSTAIVQLCRFVLLFKRNCHPKGVCINWSSISQESTNVKILNQGQDATSVWSLVICTAHTHTVEGGAACNSKYKQIPT